MKTALVLAFAATLAFAQGAPKDAKKPAPVKAEPAKAEAPKTAIKPAEAGLVGNKDSQTFHKADCKTAAKMKPANKVSLTSKADAEKAGFKACKVCKP